jgi:hypothetical protein
MNEIKRVLEFLHRTGYVTCQIVSRSSAGSAINILAYDPMFKEMVAIGIRHPSPRGKAHTGPSLDSLEGLCNKLRWHGTIRSDTVVCYANGEIDHIVNIERRYMP